MKDELKKKMEELANEQAFRKGNAHTLRDEPAWHYTLIDFKKGFQSCHDLMKKDYDAKVQKLVEQVREYADLHHAPKLEEALAEFEK